MDMLAAMRASAGLAQRRYGNFTVHTNSRSEPWLREILPQADIVVSHDNVYLGVNPAFLGWSRLWTWRQQTSEFLHIDLDFLLGPAWQDAGSDVAVMGQWWEDTTDPRLAGYYDWQANHARLKLPTDLLDLDASAPAINTGCLWVRNTAFIQIYVDAVERLMQHNHSMFSDSLPLTAPTLEQHILGMLLQKHSVIADVLIQTDQEYRPINNRFIHFLGPRWKNRELPLAQSVLARTLDSWVTPEISDIARRLDQEHARAQQ